MTVPAQTIGSVLLFGSGEMTPTGGQILEGIVKKAGISTPLRIGILETPTGFEVNAMHGWPERMEQHFARRLQNYHPVITRIAAWKKGNGPHGTSNSRIVGPIASQQIIYCGAGSPTYVVNNLRGSKALTLMEKALSDGVILALGSATAMAMGATVIPVYEIFKAGSRVRWVPGLDMFGRFGIHMAIVPHWNNQEGEDFDTSRCWMGESRFARLLGLLPRPMAVLGIDESTACHMRLSEGVFEVLGTGSIHILRDGTELVFGPGETGDLGFLAETRLFRGKL